MDVLWGIEDNAPNLTSVGEGRDYVGEPCPLAGDVLGSELCFNLHEPHQGSGGLKGGSLINTTATVAGMGCRGNIKY